MNFLSVILFFSVILAVSYCEDVHDRWENHKTLHGLLFESDEEHDMRKGLFVEKDQLIQDRNSQDLPYKLVHNTFSHLTPVEKQLYFGHKSRRNISSSTRIPLLRILDRQDIPNSLDYRQDLCMGPIKDQSDPQDCGSCWTFAATNPIEFNSCKNKGGNDYISFSEQELVDCVPDPYDGSQLGCNGGDATVAWDWLKNQNQGTDTTSSYPYTAEDGTCSVSSGSVGAQVIDWAKITPGDVDAMKSALVQHGPIAVAISASEAFQSYRSGVFTDTDCDFVTVNHAVAVIGWDNDVDSGLDYWIVRNSWGVGDDWNPTGDNGYYYLQMGVNKCSIESEPAFVVLAQ